MVRLLVEHGASVMPHASGDFLYSNVNLYFGGTVLGFAACLNNVEIVDYLLAHGAQVNAIDAGNISGRHLAVSSGMAKANTVLHCCVLHERDAMYRHLCQNHSASPWATNIHGDTPMLLATRRESVKMVYAAMDALKLRLWVFGPVSVEREGRRWRGGVRRGGGREKREGSGGKWREGQGRGGKGRGEEGRQGQKGGWGTPFGSPATTTLAGELRALPTL